jgi:long-subunit acyl-CoA synthetase (AMP-forming)
MQIWWKNISHQYSHHKCLENYTYNQVDQITTAIGSWLLKNGNKVFYIHSKNRVEWALADISCLKYGIVSVPLYDTLGK